MKCNQVAITVCTVLCILAVLSGCATVPNGTVTRSGGRTSSFKGSPEEPSTNKHHRSSESFVGSDMKRFLGSQSISALPTEYLISDLGVRYTPHQFKIMDSWKGRLHGHHFELTIYQYQPVPPSTVVPGIIVAESIDGKVKQAVMPSYNAVWVEKFTGSTVVFQGRSSMGTVSKWFVLNLDTGAFKRDTNANSDTNASNYIIGLAHHYRVRSYLTHFVLENVKIGSQISFVVAPHGDMSTEYMNPHIVRRSQNRFFITLRNMSPGKYPMNRRIPLKKNPYATAMELTKDGSNVTVVIDLKKTTSSFQIGLSGGFIVTVLFHNRPNA